MFPDRYVLIRPGVHHYRVGTDRATLCGLHVRPSHAVFDYPPEGTRACGSCRRHPRSRAFRGGR